MSKDVEMMARLSSMVADLKPKEEEAPTPEVVVEASSVDAEPSPVETPEISYSAYEKVARSQGWRPKDEYKGNPEDWVDADVFVERGPVFKHVEKLKKTVENESLENKKLRDMVGALLSDIKSAEAKAREKVLKELESQKAKAMEANDLASYKAIEAQAAEYIKPSESATPVAAPKGPSPAYQAVLAKHPWIAEVETDDLAAEKFFYCNREIDKYLKSNPKATEEEQYAIVDRVIAERYTEDAKQIKPKVSGAVASSASGKPNSKDSAKINLSNLTASQKIIYESLKDSQYGMSQADYLKVLSERNN